MLRFGGRQKLCGLRLFEKSWMVINRGVLSCCSRMDLVCFCFDGRVERRKIDIAFLDWEKVIQVVFQ